MLKDSYSSGGILLMSLVVFGMFTIMMMVSVDYINRQFKQTVHDEHTSRSFQVAEAGVHYALWLLGNNVYGENTPQYLADLVEPLERDVNDPEDESVNIGTFYLTFQRIEGDDSEKIMVTASGQDNPGRTRCETIVATLRKVQDANGMENYAITSWDHLASCSHE